MYETCYNLQNNSAIKYIYSLHIYNPVSQVQVLQQDVLSLIAALIIYQMPAWKLNIHKNTIKMKPSLPK